MNPKKSGAKKIQLGKNHWDIRDKIVAHIQWLYPFIEGYNTEAFGKVPKTRHPGEVVFRYILFSLLLNTECRELPLNQLGVLCGWDPHATNIHSTVSRWRDILLRRYPYDEEKLRFVDQAVEEIKVLMNNRDIDVLLDYPVCDGVRFFATRDPEGYPLSLIQAAVLHDEKGNWISKKYLLFLTEQLEVAQKKFLSLFEKQLSFYFRSNRLMPLCVVTEVLSRKNTMWESMVVDRLRSTKTYPTNWI